LGEPAAQHAATVSVDVVQRLARAAAMRFIGPGDDEWPSGLDDLQPAESIQRVRGEPFMAASAAVTTVEENPKKSVIKIRPRELPRS
jgi:hypothetical protein